MIHCNDIDNYDDVLFDDDDVADNGDDINNNKNMMIKSKSVSKRFIFKAININININCRWWRHTTDRSMLHLATSCSQMRQQPRHYGKK